MSEQAPQPHVKPELDWTRFYRLLFFFIALLPITILLFSVYRILLVPFFLSIFFSYLLSPYVDFLARYKIPRTVVVTLIILVTFSTIAFTLVQIIPYIYDEVLNMMKLAPQVVIFFRERLLPVVKGYLLSFSFINEHMLDNVVLELQRMVQLSDRVQDALTTIWSTAPKVMGTLVNLIMTPLFTFFFVKDEKKILRFLKGLTPVDLRQPLGLLLSKISRTLHSVIKGQVTVAFILAILYTIGLSISGIHGGIAIGLVAGLCRLVPYLDVVVGGSLSLIVILANWQGFGQLLFVLSVFIVVQSLDGMVITPRVIGERLGIHPFVVIITVISFADFLGFWGVLLAVPIMAILKVVLTVAKPYYEASNAYGLKYLKKSKNPPKHDA